MKRIAIRQKGECGFFLVEVLVVLVLFALVGMMLAHSSVLSEQTRTRAVHQSVAAQLAIEKMELLSAIDPITLTATNNSTENISHGVMQFKRTTAITVNADGSRTININVNSLNTPFVAKASATNTFALWGSV